VATATRKDVTTIDDTDTLETVVNKLNDCRCHALPVTRRGKLVGLVTSENLGVFLQLQTAAAG
jgi:CBS domain-containing protein